MLDAVRIALSLALIAAFPKTSGQAISAWGTLNATVEGRLFAAKPFAAPCFSVYNGQPQTPDELACDYVEQNFFNSHLNRSDAFSGYMATNFEQCMTTGATCELDFTNPSNNRSFAPPANCEQGSVPNYYINVQKEDDVKAALLFVQAYNIPLSIKNTGHDFKGRSSAPGSLALWMHNLKAMALNNAFVPDGCNTSPQVALTIGAGQQFQQIYEFAHLNNVTIVGGSDQSVGMAGGYVQGGGHSSLGNSHGMAADRILQYKVVTTEGVSLTVNACQNSDLFYALRGGGGGTFAIIMEATSMASPAETYRVANINWPASNANVRAVMAQFLQNATNFALQGWGGYLTPTQGNIILTTPRLNMAQAQAAMKPLIDLTTSLGGKSEVTEIPDFISWFNGWVKGTSGTQDAVGLPILMSSRLIPQSLHNTPSDRQLLLDAIMAAFGNSSFSQIHFTSPYGFNGTNGTDTSVNPLWRTSLYQVVAINDYFFNSTLAEREAGYIATTTAMTALRNLTPNGGAYHNEADIHEPSWQWSFFGPYYNVLLAIKKKYDPNHILDCWQCVGWDYTLPKYSCYILTH